MIRHRASRILGLGIACCLVGWACIAESRAWQTPSVSHQPPPDGTWTADAVVEPIRSISDTTLGAGQGVVVRDGKIYAYGDVYSEKPRVGVIREYDMGLKPTGRAVWLRRGGTPVIVHPTGLTWNPKWGTLLGDTVMKKAKIYRLDWDRAWRDGNLDAAVLDEIDDDASINGCRPLFVTYKDKTYIATADYGDIHPELRLIDPERMLKAGRTSAPGVVVHRVLCGPWNQNLAWDASTGRLTCVQNIIEGRGWRLDTIDLARAVDHGRADGPGVRIKTYTFAPHDELEGYWPVDGDRVLFATSSRTDNLVLGVVKSTETRVSPPVKTER